MQRAGCCWPPPAPEAAAACCCCWSPCCSWNQQHSWDAGQAGPHPRPVRTHTQAAAAQQQCERNGNTATQHAKHAAHSCGSHARLYFQVPVSAAMCDAMCEGLECVGCPCLPPFPLTPRLTPPGGAWPPLRRQLLPRPSPPCPPPRAPPAPTRAASCAPPGARAPQAPRAHPAAWRASWQLQDEGTAAGISTATTAATAVTAATAQGRTEPHAVRRILRVGVQHKDSPAVALPCSCDRLTGVSAPTVMPHHHTSSMPVTQDSSLQVCQHVGCSREQATKETKVRAEKSPTPLLPQPQVGTAVSVCPAHPHRG